MKNQSKIPTLLGLAIIGVSLIATVFLFKNVQKFLSRAAVDIVPSEIKITNISPVGFTVSWITSGAAAGSLVYGAEKPESVTLDDRDQMSAKTGEYLTHHVSVRFLKANTKYFYKIISGGKTFDNNGEPYFIKTTSSPTEANPAFPPAYGTVSKSDGTPAGDTIVYLNLVSGFSYSGLTKSSGNWLIAFIFGQPQTNDEKIDLLAQGGTDGTSQVVTAAGNLSPVPKIILGKSYDFRKTDSGFKAPPAAESAPSLLTPASGSAIPGDRPVFSGTGIPGTVVTIEVNSVTPVAGTTIVNDNGHWSWTPPAGLAPGEHSVKIKTTDKFGMALEIVKTFLVLASGSSVVEAATPSASATPSAQAKPTPQPSPSATPSTAPASGNLTPTLFLLLLSISLLVLGTGKLIFSVDN